MLGDRWNRIEEIFHAALERPLPERDAYLVHACGDDRTLRSEVESLLANDGDGGTTIDLLVGNDLKELARASSQSDSGLQIGPYRLVRELDSGGMGVVHLAVRSDDHYFQVVAIKTIRKGLASPDLVQRFRAERQILATLTHPNIGAILDGGDTDDGRPYIVMEYVEGQPITIAAQNQGLSVTQRIDLFRSVCSAVHYAHQKLVIHRDIKPSNVLVTPEGIVKLIDFGVSKPLAPELIPGEMPRTESWQRFMTPDYASPEQIQGHELTTATDVYSLGVLLFELLTDSRPYTLHGLSPVAAERLICEQENPRPSTVPKLSDRTRKEIAGDLDRIVLMAMEKDASRRYSSAQHLDEDLFRFLKHKPVLARKATSLYRLSKFLRRHSTASIMACTTVLVLIGSVFFHQWQSRRADRKLIEVELLADSAISDMTGKLQASSASVETQASIFRSALQYLNQLRQNSGDDPRLLLELVKAYERVGDLEGSPVGENLGNSEAALHSYQEAFRTATQAHSLLPGDESTRALIDACERLAYMEYSWTSLENLQKATEHFQQCLPMARDFWKQNPADPMRRDLLAHAYSGLGNIEEASREPDKALKDFRTALEIIGNDPNGDEKHDMRLPNLYELIGLQLEYLGVHKESFVNFDKAITIAETMARRSSPSTMTQSHLYLAYDAIIGPLAGDEMVNVGNYTQAQAYARKALKIAEEQGEADSKNAGARSDLGFSYWEMGNVYRLTKPSTAASWYRKSILLAREMSPPSEADFHIATREEALGAVLIKTGHAVEGLHLLEDANARRQKLERSAPGLPLPGERLMRSNCSLSDAELAVNDLANARRYAESAIPFLNSFPLTSPDLRVLRDVGLCYESLGNVQRQISMDSSFSPGERHAAEIQARQWLQKSADVWSEWKRRNASTPESEIERHKVELLLRHVGPTSDQHRTASRSLSKDTSSPRSN
jgi:serine/threonine protein kinase